MQTFLDAIFIGLSISFLFYSLVSRFNVAASTYLAATIGYTLLAHTVWRLQKSPAYSDDTYLIAHLIEFGYLVLFVAMMLNSQKGNEFFYRAIALSRSTILGSIFLAWFTFQGYLILKYGTTGSFTLNSDNVGSEKDYIDASLQSLLNTFANGSALMVVGRLAIEPSIRRNIILVAPLAAFVLYNLAFATAAAGGRRTILLLGLFYAVIKFTASGENLGTAVRRSFLPAALALASILGLSSYYQEIRLNTYLPEVGQLLGSPELSKKIDGLILMLTPGAAADYGIQSDSLSGAVNRSGAFDNLYSIAEGVVGNGVTLDGELTMFSIGKSIPRSLYPNKPDYDIDVLIAQRYNIAPGQDFGVRADFFLEPDYSTTILSMFVSDFSWLGVFVAAAVMSIVIRLETWSLSLFLNNNIVTTGLMGALFEMVATLEGSLINVLATLRTVILIIILGLVITTSWEFASTPLKGKQATSRRSANEKRSLGPRSAKRS